VSDGDPRNIESGWPIAADGYCDQPYVVVNDDGSWCCVMTTGPGQEGDLRQHVVSTISGDQGRTWSPLVDIEPLGPPEASWVMPVRTPGGRIYAVYVHNTDNVREVRTPDGATIKRADVLGHYVFKYSDDGGRSWSAERYEIPLRTFEIDRRNTYGGELRFFWGVGKPIVHHGAVYFGAAKVANLGGGATGMLLGSEGIVLKSDNLLTEPDPARVRWETLPEGDVGLRAPLGPVAEEHSVVGLSDGSLYCVYRTVEGYLGQAYSRDAGRTWTPPAYATYQPDTRADPLAWGVAGEPRRIKHPRAAGFVWKCNNGNYLLWFHNHGGRWFHYRNPAWVSGGVERDGPDGKVIHWSEPEILLYDSDPDARMSYPDFVEHGGSYWVTETQKKVARVHQVDPSLLEGMWRQHGRHEASEVTTHGLLLSLAGDHCAPGAAAPQLPPLPDLDRGGGFTLDVWFETDTYETRQTLLDARDADGRGVLLEVPGSQGMRTVRLSLTGAARQCAWDSDPWQLMGRRRQHVVAIVDGGPKIVSYVINGQLCDGGLARQYGWGRFDSQLGLPAGSRRLSLADGAHARLLSVRVYDRALRTSEAVASWRAGV
jgi:hypothetical protein